MQSTKELNRFFYASIVMFWLVSAFLFWQNRDGMFNRQPTANATPGESVSK